MVPMGLSRQTHGPTPASFPLPSPRAGGQETCYAPGSAEVQLMHTSLGREAEMLRDTGTPCPSTAAVHLPLGTACTPTDTRATKCHRHHGTNLLHPLQHSPWMDDLASASSPAGKCSQGQQKLVIMSPDHAARTAVMDLDQVWMSGWLSRSRGRTTVCTPGVHQAMGAHRSLHPKVRKHPLQRRKSHLGARSIC